MQPHQAHPIVPNDWVVYKICSGPEWRQAETSGTYTGSSDDIRDGFIHLSVAAQLHGTLQRHFAGRSDLVLIAFDATSLGDGLRWEASRGGSLFPHLYVPLPATEALGVWPIGIGPGGVHQLPDLCALGPASV